MKYLVHSTFILFLLFTSCKNKNNDSSENIVTTISLYKYETIISNELGLLANPNIIKYRDNIFIYDNIVKQIIEIDKDNNIIREFGRVGAGPGEYINVNNIYINQKYLYIVDTVLLVVHQYSRAGSYISSFDFGMYLNKSAPPPAPFDPNVIMANDLNNKPFVTPDDKVLLSVIDMKNNSQKKIFGLYNWEGNKIMEIGRVPKNSTFLLDYDKLKNEINNRETPSFHKTNSFPVNVGNNTKEYFIVYTSIPKISKYDSSGQEVWSKVPKSIEIDTIKANYFNVMDRMVNSRNRVDLKFYISGTSSSKGDLFLVVNTEPITIHHFNNLGELIHKIQFISEDITPVLDFDFSEERILVISKTGEVRAYSFNW